MTNERLKSHERQAKLDSLVARVRSFIQRHRLFSAGETVLVGVSAGSDSMALLHLLQAAKLQLKLVVAYIDHGLRPSESPKERRLVGEYCASQGIPFVVKFVDVPLLLAEEKRSPEDAARLLRYQALEELRRLRGATAIAVGHTADDQVEEFFLRLLRGSGRKGLCGMEPRRGAVVRPLLEERKATLTSYLENHNLPWCFDSSNAHRDYLRNRVRLDLLPYLERDFSPGLHHTIHRVMEIVRPEEELLTSLALAAFEACRVEDEKSNTIPLALALDLASCRQQHPALLRRIIETSFWHMGARPTFRQIDIVRNFLERGKTGGMLHLEGGLRAEIQEGRLRFTRPHRPTKGRMIFTPPAIDLPIPGPGSYPLPVIGKELRLRLLPRLEGQDSGRLLLDAATVTFPLQLRTVRPGERFHPCEGIGSKKINRFLNERKVPASLRFVWPVLAEGNLILAIPGMEIDHHCRITETTRDVLAIEWLDLENIDNKA